jgi:DNA-binding cell septation regulator SpoVG
MPNTEAPKPPRVEVTNIRAVPGGTGNLRAYASVKIGPLVIHDCRLIQQNGQRAWVSPPQSSWKTSSGETKYKPLIEWPDHWKDAIRDAVLAGYEAL